MLQEPEDVWRPERARVAEEVCGRRLLDLRDEDGQWDGGAFFPADFSRAEHGATVSSFDTTIDVVEGLLEFELAHGPDDAVGEARRGGEVYLLERGLFRGRRSGEPIEEFLVLARPYRWHHDLLRGLDHFRAASLATDGTRASRLTDAVDQLRVRREANGTWHLEHRHPGRRWFDHGASVGQPSRWLSLKALRILGWWTDASPSALRLPTVSCTTEWT